MTGYTQSEGGFLSKIKPYLLALLCLSLLTGHNLYFLNPALTILRLSVAVAIGYLLVQRQLPKEKLFYAVVLWFVIYAGWTCAVTFLWPQAIDWSKMLNFLTIPIIVFALLGLMIDNPRPALKWLFYIALLYEVAMLAIGAWEIYSGWHFPSSRMRDELNANMRIPTGVYRNENDLSTLVVLAAVYASSYAYVFLTGKKRHIGLAALVATIPLLLMTHCRIGLIVIILALAMIGRKTIIKYKYVAIALAVLAIVACLIIWLRDTSPWFRMNLYKESLFSPYDSYGLGFGINGEHYYLSKINNYDYTKYYTNVHSYLFEILVCSGLPLFITYCGGVAYLMRRMARHGRNEFWLMPLLYLLMLFAPSSSTMFWGQYVFFAGIVVYAVYCGRDYASVASGVD